MTTLYLVRHGETFDNARQIMQGQVQGELNDTGIQQAKAVRDQLSTTHFDAIVSSDLKRAIDTAAIIATPHHLDVNTTPLLRERDWGDFTGCFIPDLKGKPWPANVESLEQLQHRASEFLDFIRRNYPNQQILAVGHGIINKAIQAVHFGKQMQDVDRMKNAEVRILSI